MRFYSEYEFCTTALKTLIEVAKVDNGSVLFITYRTINNYPKGPVETNKSGLNIFVLSGDGIKDVSTALRTVKTEYKRVVRRKRWMNPRLVVIYAGDSLFNQTLAFAQTFKKKGISTVIVTCTCLYDVWGRMTLANSGFEHAVFGDCGAKKSMCYILSSAIAAW